MSEIRELTHEDVQKMVSSYMNAEHVALVEKAYRFAEVCHHDQRRKSGEPYIMNFSKSSNGSRNCCGWLPA